MSYAHRIIDKFGGIRAAAAALSKAPSTVQGWKNRGSIPDAEKAKVLAAAVQKGVELTRNDFWPSGAPEDAA
ncbi:carph-isopro domain-containing protein [Paracoccus sulfuroxidans]|uniref:carph-isopro domain-containing protein n=1 Tax=Paracoccus sulfuroxidans TaxID=384678 RepID=UPI000FDF7108|nr:hypothetical protein [Paracoccus sulfuroxidans]AZV00326.1 Cro-like protein [Paracoccus phage vB_PsuS_Psul1]